MAILEYMKSLKESEPLYVIGRSLGGAVASYMVSLDETVFDGLILENTFTSIADMVDSMFYFVGYVKWVILRIGWDTRSLVQNMQLPILFISGDKDELVPW